MILAAHLSPRYSDIFDNPIRRSALLAALTTSSVTIRTQPHIDAVVRLIYVESGHLAGLQPPDMFVQVDQALPEDRRLRGASMPHPSLTHPAVFDDAAADLRQAGQPFGELPLPSE